MRRVAIYGLEGHESVILSAVARRDDAVLAAVASDNAEALEHLKGDPAVTAETRLYKDWPEMLESEEIDVLAVCSPTNRHVEPIVEAAARGIHVVSEKPIAVDRAGAARVRKAVEEAGIGFSVLYDMRMSPPFRAMQKAVRAGAIGKPIVIFGQKSYRLGIRPEWMKRRESFGGIIPYIGCHMLDLAMWMTGLDVTRVAAFHGNAGKPEIEEMEDHAVVALEMTQGAAMAMTLDYLRPSSAHTHGDTRLRIAGSEGVVEVKDLETRAELIVAGQGPRDLPLEGPLNLFEDFLDALDGRKEHVVSPAEAFRVTEVLIAALDAADEGRMVEV